MTKAFFNVFLSSKNKSLGEILYSVYLHNIFPAKFIRSMSQQNTRRGVSGSGGRSSLPNSDAFHRQRRVTFYQLTTYFAFRFWTTLCFSCLFYFDFGDSLVKIWFWETGLFQFFICSCCCWKRTELWIYFPIIRNKIR